MDGKYERMPGLRNGMETLQTDRAIAETGTAGILWPPLVHCIPV
jgi:hypothetical protein